MRATSGAAAMELDAGLAFRGAQRENGNLLLVWVVMLRP